MILHPIISVAPMMNYTDRHARYFFRLFSPVIHLYTEMITTKALLHGDAKKLLGFHPHEKYLALQLGGSDIKELMKCVKMGEEAGFNEINLNVGCPSHRVREGQFGACLMLQPDLVAACFSNMQAQVEIPVTIKCRIGVDQQDSYASLHHFISTLATAGCKTFIIHARKAWLAGLSPKENREIPQLRYDIVRQVKKDFPHLCIILNGGLKTIADINQELPHVDGMMLGRAIYSNPFLLAEIHNHYFTDKKEITRFLVVQKFIPYIEEELRKGNRLSQIARPLFGLFQYQKGASAWRRFLSENIYKKNVGVEVIEQALAIKSMF